MKVEIAQHERMTESGSSLLRLIQNQDIPVLDLLVREAFQNALDAGNPDSGMNAVRIDVLCKEFSAPALNRHFDLIRDKLNNTYPNNKRYKSIIISDRGTTGLTGPMTYEEVKNNEFGNLLKLIYEISKPQTREGSGGSWGLGKTVYYRVGMGLVIYYSRIRLPNGKYESRLAACLVENEKKRRTLLPSGDGVQRGIAWWGEEKSKGFMGKKYTVPLTNEREISHILNVFNFQPYTENETGTTFIIPYIDESRLLNETFEADGFRPPWTYSIEEYLRVAVQRWYAPRINNPDYKGLSLRVWIGSSMIKPTDMLPLFRGIREMYIYNETGSLPQDSFLESVGAELHKEGIQVRGVLNSGNSGEVIFTKLNTEQLKMIPPENNLSPYTMISNNEISMEQGNIPIVMYTRKPAMIVGYNYNGPWTNRIPRTADNEYIIGFFIANSENTFKMIKDHESDKQLSIEEYLRQCEKADHAVWADKSIDGINTRLIQRMQNGVNTKIASVYKEPSSRVSMKRDFGLGYALAKYLLPARGFGNDPIDPPRPPQTPPRSGNKTNVVQLTLNESPVYSSESFYIDFQLLQRVPESAVYMQVVTDFRRMNSDTWEEEMETGFPFSLNEITITDIKTADKRAHWQKRNIRLNSEEADEMETDELKITLSRSARTGNATGYIVRMRGCAAVQGRMSFHTLDRSLSMGFETKEVKT